jgi:stage II sporulation protein M
MFKWGYVCLYKYKTAILEDLNDNKTAYLLIVFFILMGLSAGAFTAGKLPDADKAEATNYISVLVDSVKNTQLDFLKVFYNSCLQNITFFAIIIIFSFWPLTIPIVILAEAIKGFYIGFAIGVLTLEFSANSFILVLIVVMLPNLVLLPCLIKAGVLGISNAITVFRNRKIPSTSKDKLINARPFFIKMLKVFLISLLGVLLETILTPLLIKVV